MKNNRKIWNTIKELPGILLIVVWPFVMRRISVRSRLDKEAFYPDAPYINDIFLVSRGHVLLILAGLMVLIMICERSIFLYDKEKTAHKRGSVRNWGIIVILLAAYVILTVLSSGLSQHPDAAFFGVADSFETVPVIIGYLIILIYSIFCLREEGWRERAAVCFIFTATLLGFLGISQMTGHDFWNTAAGKWILSGNAQMNLVFDTMADGTRQVYLTFYNPNYAAVYLLMQLCICIGFTIKHAVNIRRADIVSKKGKSVSITNSSDLWKTAGGCIAVLLTLICLYGTRSKASVMVIAALGFLCAFAQLATRRHGKRNTLVLTVLSITVITGLLYIPGDNIVKQLRDKMYYSEKRNYLLQDVEVREDGIHVFLGEDEIWMRIIEQGAAVSLQVADRNGKDIPYHWNQETERFVFENEDWMRYTFNAFTEDDQIHILFWHNLVEWHFMKTIGQNDYRYVNYVGKADTIEKAPQAFGEGYERKFTRRVYIWGVTAALLPERIFLGCGVENFAFIFPQNDYVKKSILGYVGSREWYVRPHSLYLQIAMNSGVIALICLTAAIIFLLIPVLKDLYKKRDILNTCFLLSVISFFIMGLANDSMVTVTPVFCLILGSLAAASFSDPQ